MELFEIRKLLSITITERNKLEKELLENRLKLREGSLIERYVICGKDGCKCSKGEGKHGPFLYLNKKVDGKNIQEYIKDKNSKLINELKRYKAFQDKLAKIRKLNKKINELLNELRNGLTI